MENIINFFKTEYWFYQYDIYHILFLIPILAASVFTCLYIRKLSEKKFKIVILILFIIMVFFELIKQFITNTNDNSFNDSYNWWYGPIAFCSTPYYVIPFVIWQKDSKLRDAFLSFTSTFILFGGFIVTFIFTSGVFCRFLFINIQTLVHHGTQFLMSLAVVVYYKEKFNFKFFLKGLYVFLGFVLVAFLVNILFFKDSANAFQISPYFTPGLAILNLIYSPGKGVFAYVVFLITYVFGFALTGYIIYLIEKACFSIKKNKSIE